MSVSIGVEGSASKLLRPWGWELMEGLKHQGTTLGQESKNCVGRVMVNRQRLCRVQLGAEVVDARVPGRAFRAGSGWERLPVVGDWVCLKGVGEHGMATITEVFPRRSCFSRQMAGKESKQQVLAANIDAVWLIHGLDIPLNKKRMERFLSAGFQSGGRPVIVLTKADVVDDPLAQLEEARAFSEEVEVFVVCALSGSGVEALRQSLNARETAALLGPSGAGKSTLINRLCGAERLEVGEVRERDRKGRHTTTHRELLMLPSGAMVIDTPGLRELQLWDVAEGVDQAFPDIYDLSRGCRFRDCQHRAEPECQVQAAVDSGRLSQQRLESYHKLVHEAAAQYARGDEKARIELKRQSQRSHQGVKSRVGLRRRD